MLLPDVLQQATECRIVLLLCLLFLLVSTSEVFTTYNPQGCSVTGEISGNIWVLFVNAILALRDV
jgi:hypothetical protein